MGGVGLVACQCFLVRGELVSVFWWVELDLFSLKCNEVSSREFWGVYGFGMDLGRLSIANHIFLGSNKTGTQS